MTQISAFNPAADAGGSRVPSQFSKLSSEDFIRIIFTELSNQDPFQPNDSQALLNQLNSIRSIESDIKLTQQLETLVAENQLASASNMIGKFIGGLSVDNFRVAGFVVSVIRQGNEVNLELDNGWIVPIKGVEQVINPPENWPSA
jgi:flagellar basal-body rod modification protein FlgD